MAEVTIEEIRGLPVEILSQKDTQVIADFLVPRISIVSTPIGIGTVLAVMAPIGGAFLNALEAMAPYEANVKWALEMIKQGTFDVGHPVTRAQLLAFASAQPDLSGAISALLKVAEQSNKVTEMAVRVLCWSANGEWQV